MCETTDLIKKMAHEGKSKEAIRNVLGVSRRSLNDMLDLIGPVTFYRGPTYTVRGFHGTVKQIIDHFDLDVAERTVRFRMEDLYTVEESFFGKDSDSLDEVRGFKGTTVDIIRHFGLTISKDRVYKRKKAGLSLEEAYFSPLNPTKVRAFTNNRPTQSLFQGATL